jgi:hypothetical protein
MTLISHTLALLRQGDLHEAQEALNSLSVDNEDAKYAELLKILFFSHQECAQLAVNRSVSDCVAYVAAAKLATENDFLFKIFRRLEGIRAIVETVTPALGAAYLEIVKRDSPDFLFELESLRRTNSVGSPFVTDYGTEGMLSPTTLRYLKVASDLRKYFGTDLGGDVAEIGGGYGGQLVVCDRFLGYGTYEIFDLPPVLELTSRYIENFILRGGYFLSTINQSSGKKHYDLVISNYAFTELPRSLQSIYIKKILSRSLRGYITLNSGVEGSAYADSDRYSLSELRAALPPFRIIPEEPLSAAGNFIIVWGL